MVWADEPSKRTFHKKWPSVASADQRTGTDAEKWSAVTAVSFRPNESILRIDRKFSDSRRAIIHQRQSQVQHKNGNIKLRLILDRFSVEVFVNDGEQVLTATFYTEQSADGISFFANGTVDMDIAKYDLSG